MCTRRNVWGDGVTMPAPDPMLQEIQKRLEARNTDGYRGENCLIVCLDHIVIWVGQHVSIADFYGAWFVVVLCSTYYSNALW